MLLTNLHSTSLSAPYVAGIIDGEGSLMLRRTRSAQTKPMPIVLVRMCHEETIRLLAEFYEPNGHYIVDDGRNPQFKRSWNVAWRGKRVYGLLKLIRPYLITKAAQADLLLEVEQFASRHRGRPPKGTSWWTQEELNRMGEMLAEIKRLNKRGR